jgi:hypothetical protein
MCGGGNTCSAGTCCNPAYHQPQTASVSGQTQAQWAFFPVWCSWANQCGGAQYGDGYWLTGQTCTNWSCASPGTAGDSCSLAHNAGHPERCGDHCYDSDAWWTVGYIEYYQGEFACNGITVNPKYLGSGCPGHW